MTEGVSRQLTAFLAGLDGTALPAPLVAETGRQLVDVIGCMRAGGMLPEGHAVTNWFASLGGGAYRVAGRAEGFALGPAVAANAMLSHLAEADPVHAETVSCIAAPVIPLLLTLAQTEHVSGVDALTGIIAGYEAIARIGRHLRGDRMFARGWWPTALLGAAGAAVATARALRLPAGQMQDALGLALLHSGGLAAGGTDAPQGRNLLLGNMARLGLEMALAARHGIAGPQEALAGERSFTTALSAEADGSALLEALGERWAVMETSIKAHPCALQAQSALDVLATLCATQIVNAGDVAAIEIELPTAMLGVVNRPNGAGTRMEAMASLQFLVAAKLLDGDIVLPRFDAPGREDAAAWALAARVTVRGAEDLDAAYPAAWPSRVAIRLSDGRVLRHDVQYPAGHPQRAFGRAEIAGKYSRLTGADPTALMAVTRDLRDCTDFAAVGAFLHA